MQISRIRLSDKNLTFSPAAHGLGRAGSRKRGGRDVERVSKRPWSFSSAREVTLTIVATSGRRTS
ncbi:MAG: hypothetical protein ACJ8ED_13705, partial [Xanthobacteraceae bacterium]